ncbi:uncharacterized protein LOC126746700 [Anthonomus grandis grandis]|uniref:uncharacterized protein LOC126746700 n=1 Tax=Anthonomus grandis grandis TaxID=2921223 RepID=UPI002165CA89|nr:uncharacterized protein LOC126746700 [Anthonomus grandis grandis]
MTHKHFYYLVILVASPLISTALGLKCFQCNSAESPDCATLKSNDTDISPHLKDCEVNQPDHEPFCRKIVTKILDGESVRVIRSCGWILQEPARRNDTCRSNDSDYVLRTSCYCFSDACNRATPLGAAPLSTTLLIVSLAKVIIRSIDIVF